MMYYRPENTDIDLGVASATPRSISVFSGRYIIIAQLTSAFIFAT